LETPHKDRKRKNNEISNKTKYSSWWSRPNEY